MNRRKLPNRRASTVFDFKVGTMRYTGSYGQFPDGRPSEVFVNTSQRSGSEADTNAADGAVAVSLALQYGCSLQTLRDAMKRAPDGTAQGPLGAALDAIAGMER